METIIFTDGASKGNPGRGGWGAVVVMGNEVTELGGREQNTTNNRMELVAAIEALRFIRHHNIPAATVYSDSKYVLNGITAWVHGWKKNGWKTKTGERVLNEELWKELSELAHVPSIHIKWQYVGGHIAVAGNERADSIATGFAEGKEVQLYHGSLDEYGLDVLNINHNELLLAEKSAQKNHSKAKAYSYVSKVDGVVQTHKTWAECEARIRGKRARYKKALSQEDERKIITEFSR